MSAHQMVCHLADSFRGVMGEKALAVKPGAFGRGMMKWVALYSGIPWPHGVKTMPEMDQLIAGTRPAEFAAEARELRKLFERYTGQPWDFVRARHPMFPEMSDADWMRWA